MKASSRTDVREVTGTRGLGWRPHACVCECGHNCSGAPCPSIIHLRVDWEQKWHKHTPELNDFSRGMKPNYVREESSPTLNYSDTMRKLNQNSVSTYNLSPNPSSTYHVTHYICHLINLFRTQLNFAVILVLNIPVALLWDRCPRNVLI